MLQMFRPVMPVAPKKLNRKPPTRAPIIPSAMLSQKPWPSALTILPPMNPAIRPSIIQLIIDMCCLPSNYALDLGSPRRFCPCEGPTQEHLTVLSGIDGVEFYLNFI